MAAGAGPRPTWCVFRRARRPGGPRHAQWSRPTVVRISVGAHSVRPRAAKGRPYNDSSQFSLPQSALRLTAPSSEGAKEKIPLTWEVAFAKQMTEGETGRPHGAAPTNPNGRGGWTKTPHPSRPSAVPPSPEGEGKGPPKAAAPTGDRRGAGQTHRCAPTWRRRQSPTLSGLRPSPPDRGSRPPPYMVRIP